MKIRIAVLWLAVSLVSGAEKKRDWKTAKVLDSLTEKQFFAPTAIVSNGSHSPLPTGGAIKKTEINIAGEGYGYTLLQTERVGPLAKKGCRFIVNETIQYSQEKGIVYVRDTDGKECKLEIEKQIKIEQPPPSPKP